MSTKGVYTALSGAMAQSEKLDTIANNLANVNTPGFKRDAQVFREYLTSFEKEGAVMRVPRVPASVESFYDMNGGDKGFVDSAGTYSDFSPGSAKSTGNPLDAYIEGDGFFEVATTDGTKLTRTGSFTLDGNGQLVTKDGQPVLASGEAGSDPASRVISITEPGPVTINDSGDILQNGQTIARLSVVQVSDKNALQKIGSNLYKFKENFRPEVQVTQNPKLKQGFLEMSNVNVVQEMTDLIQTSRVFESTQKAISAYDQIADKLVNVVGKTTA